MRTALVLAWLALLPPVGACAAPTDEPDERAGPTLSAERCADVVVLGLRGAGQDADRNRGAGTEVRASVEAMADRLPRGSDATVRLQASATGPIAHRPARSSRPTSTTG